ncbi:unnamed protein product [Paramecium sonneborni]|uniref:Uncharacterized protein n=1 Tax=Paramecium sonneborni TaxID=65129 RepID=A0A8S1KKX2_9CILI|nr:unnamed protein product [Paramecium sonneborni]
MHKLRQLQEKEEQSLSTEQVFVPFIKERDSLGKLQTNHKRNISHKQVLKKKSDKKNNVIISKSVHTKSKVNFLKDVYTINHNTVWANLTQVSRLEKKFNLKIQTEYVEQKPLQLLNQKLFLNDGLVKHKTQTQLNNSPKLGKNLSMNTIPPIGYYQPKDIQIKRQPMFVKMTQQQETNRQIKKVIKTECSQTTQIPKLEFSNIKIQNKIPQELLEKAYLTERISTQQRFRYTPLHFDNEEIELQESKINQLRQFYQIMKNSIS